MANNKTENAIVLYGPAPAKAGNASFAADSPLPLDAPAMDASHEALTIDLAAFETRIEPPQSEPIESDAGPKSAAPPQATVADWRKFAPLAASVALAALLGALGGAAAITALSHDAPATATAAAALSGENRTLQEKVVRLSSELTAVKAGMDAANRTTVSHLGRINERLDRSEKAQSDPAARLARIAESLDRLERRTVAAAPDTTGSVTSVEKQQTKPAVIEGWKLLDYYAGRAVLENRAGTLYEVGPGSNLPGVGKVETVKRVDGKVIVTTPKGIITSALEPPRRPAYYRY